MNNTILGLKDADRSVSRVAAPTTTTKRKKLKFSGRRQQREKYQFIPLDAEKKRRKKKSFHDFDRRKSYPDDYQQT